MLQGYRNTCLGIFYIFSCLGLAYMAPEQIKDLGPTFLSLGGGVVGTVFGRAFNKKHENGNNGGK